MFAFHRFDLENADLKSVKCLALAPAQLTTPVHFSHELSQNNLSNRFLNN